MLRHASVRIEMLAFAGIALLLVARPGMAQQGWPYNGDNWSFRGGSRGSSSYSPSYYSGRPAYSGGYSNTVVSSPYYYGAPSNASAPSANYSSIAYYPPLDSAAHIRLIVPADAKVWFDDEATKQSGEIRNYVSPALEPDRTYVYEIKAQWRDKDGQEVSRTRRVSVSLDANVSVDLTRPVVRPPLAAKR